MNRGGIFKAQHSKRPLVYNKSARYLHGTFGHNSDGPKVGAPRNRNQRKGRRCTKQLPWGENRDTLGAARGEKRYVRGTFQRKNKGERKRGSLIVVREKEAVSGTGPVGVGGSMVF